MAAQLWEISVDGMRLIDEDGKILLVNDAFYKIFQMEKDNLLGKPFSIVYDRDEQEDALRTFREHIRNNKIKTLFERENTLWNGRKAWFEFSNSFLTLPDGNKITLSIVKDISERKKVEEALKESEERYRKIIEAAPYSITITRLEDGRYLQVNDSFVRIFGYSREEVLGKTPFDLEEGIFKPGFGKPIQKIDVAAEETGLQAIDHIVGSVRTNEMDLWVNYLNKSLNFETFIDFGPGDISTQYSALLSKVVRSTEGPAIKNPINEPYEGLKKSQIEEYIDEYLGSGIQHVAVITNDIIKTIAAMRKNGMEFLSVPDSYYDTLKERGFEVTEDIGELKKYGILCDIEGKGYLRQLFTKPIGDRPTFFYEIITVLTVATNLVAGTYWLACQTGATLSSGPWAPPISILGQTTTGNALQYDPATTDWNPLTDTGSGALQGLPFIVEGLVVPVELQSFDVE